MNATNALFQEAVEVKLELQGNDSLVRILERWVCILQKDILLDLDLI
jgi:hypothetical protein